VSWPNSGVSAEVRISYAGRMFRPHCIACMNGQPRVDGSLYVMRCEGLGDDRTICYTAMVGCLIVKPRKESNDSQKGVQKDVLYGVERALTDRATADRSLKVT